MKRTLAILTIGILLASVAFAEGKEEQPVTLKVMGFTGVPDTIAEYFRVFTEQTGIKVDDFVNVPGDNYRDKLIMSFLAGTEYDVIWMRDTYLAEWASAGWIAPLDGYKGMAEILKDLPPATVRDMSYDGKLYGLPYYGGREIMAFNADHLAKAGFQAPPKTWKELAEQAKQIKEKGISEYPISLQMNKTESILHTFEILTFARGGRLFGPKNEPVFQAPGSATEDALNWAIEGIKTGIIDPASLNTSFQDCIRALSAGTRSFGILTDYAVRDMNDPKKSQTAGYMKQSIVPGNEKVRSGSYGYARFYSLTSGSKHKDAAVKLIQFLGGKDTKGEYYVQKTYALRHGLLFVQNSLFNDKEIQDSINKWGDTTVLQEQDKYLVDRPYRFTVWFPEWQTEALGKLQKILMGEESVRAGLDDLAKKAVELQQKAK